LVAPLLFRVLPLGFLALAALSIAPFPVAEASSPHAHGIGAQTSRMGFRPTHSGERGAGRAGEPLSARAARSSSLAQDPRRRPLGRSPERIGGQTVSSFSERAGARKAVPVTRGQELGLRFRPDDRASPYGQGFEPPAATDPGLYSPEVQSQFRPLPKRQKPTYEEQQAESMNVPQLPPPIMPYPVPAPLPLPAYGPDRPLW
jgi:hypothetical protein